MIKAIIYDCFGVLTATDGWLPFRDRYFSHDEALFREATDLNKQADAGFITYDDFIIGVAQLAQVSGKEARSVIDDNATNAAIFTHIETLKASYKIGMLSNAADDWLSQLFTPAQVSLFDMKLLSYQTGLIKPQPEIYNLAAERLQLASSECVFIDDQERYCHAAVKTGMKAIWYQTFEQYRRDIAGYLCDTEN
jgi:FMN phosphatase YigB (HAD superfamily)